MSMVITYPDNKDNEINLNINSDFYTGNCYIPSSIRLIIAHIIDFFQHPDIGKSEIYGSIYH